MENKHTPGPWEVCDAKRPDGFHIRSNARHWSIAAAYHMAGCSDPSLDISEGEAAANARLIAAAPELLEALEVAEDVLSSIDGDSVHPCTLHKIRAAIAKARG